LWIAALLAALLPIDRLIAPDLEQGVLDQLAVRGVGDEIVGLAKLVAHWLGFGPPLIIAAIPAAALLRLEGDTLWRLELGLLAGTPGLAALAVMIAAITAGLRGVGALAGLLMLPLTIPLLIFGAGSLNPQGMDALKLLAACSMLAIAISPFAVGAAIRATRE
jgi:heme exporter protein B